jgi:hypothetical protein
VNGCGHGRDRAHTRRSARLLQMGERFHVNSGGERIPPPTETAGAPSKRSPVFPGKTSGRSP